MINVYQHRDKLTKLSGTFVRKCSVRNCTLQDDAILPRFASISFVENYNDCCDGNGYTVINVGGSYVQETPNYFIVLLPNDNVYFIEEVSRF